MVTGASCGIGFELAKAFAENGFDVLVNAEDVTITSLVPGPTDTNFFHRAGMEDTQVGQAQKDDAAQVAKQGFDALLSGDGKISRWVLEDERPKASPARFSPTSSRPPPAVRWRSPARGSSGIPNYRDGGCNGRA
ncbi:MAG: hypothetical protein JO287_17790 [Pseudonocardiales bacterium]|nr:hypothetical protein [Pseudonocardiales bacterium]